MFDPTLIAIWVVLMIGFNVPVFYLLKKNGIPQSMVLVASLFMSAGIYFAVEKVLSYPMPITWELFPPKSYGVLAYDIRESVIYLLLDDGGGVPRYYVVSIGDGKKDLGRRMAERLPDMFERARRRNGARLMYEPSLGKKYDNPLFIDLPETPAPKGVR